ncbi:RNA 2',3'-cyclic phosphodiesterase [Massilia sp. S19_KUP03_FR1]|uniref:RNA 2',3'-cyclic phosphodiesterase n=1 Tax=Massilia sp. S19_KUP03_FR1 TaxID=3025503 RepID=UPI002FCD8DF8
MQSEPDTARLFVTLWPDDTVRAALRAYRNQWQWPRSAAAMHSDKLHLTLHFLGSQPRALIPQLAQALALPFTPFGLDFGHAEVWRHGSAVLEPLAMPGALMDLHDDLGQALAGLGVTLEDRPFRPHVTMGRHASGAIAPLAPAHISWPVGGYALVESKPEHGGYVVLRAYF